MKDKINFYFATLLITVFGAGAALLIIRIADTDTSASVFATGPALEEYLGE